MNTENFSVYDGVEVAPSAVLRRLRRSKGYGSVADLPDTADPDELERQVFREEFEPLLCLPKPKSGRYNPAWDTSADVDFNAFACVDFQRTQPEFDKAKYKADKLNEQLKDLKILISMLNDRVKDKAKGRILKYVRIGVIDVDDISNWDLWMLAKYYMRALWLQKQIRELREASRKKKEKQLQKLLDSLE